MCKWHFTALIVLLCGCGGGGGGGSTSPAATTPVAPAVTPDSSRLTDNPLPASTTILSFRDYQLDLDFSSQIMQGSRTFLKIYEDNENVIFLGEFDASTPLSLALNLPVDTNALWVEWFTNNPVDGINAERIGL